MLSDGKKIAGVVNSVQCMAKVKVVTELQKMFYF